MKYTCISGHPNKSCGVLKIKDTFIMLDTPLDMMPCLDFLPLPLVYSNHFSCLNNWTPRGAGLAPDITQHLENELKECMGRVFVDSSPEVSFPDVSRSGIDMKDVDVILISNYQAMMGLPFLTELSDFDGVIYATEPTLQMAKMFMDEVVYYIERVPKMKEAFCWKDFFRSIPFPIPIDSLTVNNHTTGPKSWSTMYTPQMIISSLSRVKVVGYNEKIDIFGCLEATALSSGHCIGSCNWMINTEYEKIVYLSSSSTLTTHPKPLDLTPLKNPDVVILSNLTSHPTCNPDLSLMDLVGNIKATLLTQGNVLIPCYSSGIIYDLMECLVQQLDQNGLSNIPIFLISPVADQSLAYSNILAEWLTNSKQCKVYLPEEPFSHASFVRSGRVKHYPSVHSEQFSNDFKTPCIVLTGHPCLRFGEVVHFMELWGNSSNNLIAFTEGDFPYLESLAPYQPLQMKVSYTPIDTSLNFSQINKLLTENILPKYLILPSSYTQPPLNMPHRTDLTIDLSSTAGVKSEPGEGNSSTRITTLFPCKTSETMKLPIKRSYARITLDSDLSSNLIATVVRPGVTIASITGSLEGKDNKFTLKPLTSSSLSSWSPSQGRSLPPPNNYSYGCLDLQLFMQSLVQAGLYDSRLEHTSTGTVIHLRNEEAFINIENETTTHIVCDISSPLRPLLRELVTKCLKTY